MMDEDGNEFDLVQFQYDHANRALSFNQQIVTRSKSSSLNKRVWSCIVSSDGSSWSTGTVLQAPQMELYASFSAKKVVSVLEQEHTKEQG